MVCGVCVVYVVHMVYSVIVSVVCDVGVSNFSGHICGVVIMVNPMCGLYSV